MLFGFAVLFAVVLFDDGDADPSRASDGWQLDTVELPSGVAGAWLAGLVAVVWLVGFRVSWLRRDSAP